MFAEKSYYSLLHKRMMSSRKKYKNNPSCYKLSKVDTFYQYYQLREINLFSIYKHESSFISQYINNCYFNFTKMVVIQV